MNRNDSDLAILWQPIFDRFGMMTSKRQPWFYWTAFVWMHIHRQNLHSKWFHYFKGTVPIRTSNATIFYFLPLWPQNWLVHQKNKTGLGHKIGWNLGLECPLGCPQGVGLGCRTRTMTKFSRKTVIFDLRIKNSMNSDDQYDHLLTVRWIEPRSDWKSVYINNLFR